MGAAWKNVQESDVILGSIHLGEKDKTERRKGTLTVNPECLDTEIPTEYRIDMAPTGLKAKVFSQDGSGRMAIEGFVQHSGNVMPQRNGDYSKLCKKRLLNSMVKDRYVKALEDLPKHSKKGLQMTIEAPKSDKESEEEDETETKTSSERPDKRVKMDTEALKNLVFHYFEEREFWPLKELNSHCKQPEGVLKEILKEICIYHRKGLNKSCYELKSQYKTMK